MTVFTRLRRVALCCIALVCIPFIDFAQTFSSTAFPKPPNIVTNRSSAADVDNDGDYDLVFFGGLDYSYGRFYYLRNDGNGNYAIVNIIDMSGDVSDFIVRDIDNDGDPDILIHADDALKIFRNDAGNFNHVFTTQSHAYIPQYALADFNHDGKQDIIYSFESSNATGTNEYRILYQDNITHFIASDFHFVPLRNRDIQLFTLGDFNNDSFTDIILNSAHNIPAKAFKNVNGRTFTSVSTNLPGFQGVDYSNTIRPFDYNKDGRLDLVYENQVYLGNGNFNFTAGAQGVSYPSAFADFNEDGLPDMVTNKTALMVSTSPGNYSSMQFPNGIGDVISDFENDGDLDLVLLKIDQHEGINSYMTNLSNGNNEVPSEPSVILSSNVAGRMKLEWPAGIDSETPTEYLTYNLSLRIKNGAYIIHPETNASGSFRSRVAPGNVGTATSYILNELPAGTYTARVQTLDASYQKSPYSISLEFQILAGPENLTVEKKEFNKIVLHWTESISNEISFVVERRTPSSDFEVVATLPPNTLSYADETLAGNETYYYRVYANINGIGSASQQVTYATVLFSDTPDTDINFGKISDLADFNDDEKLDVLVSEAYVDDTEHKTKRRTLIYENTGSSFTRHDALQSDMFFAQQLEARDLNGDSRLDIFEHGPVTVSDYVTKTSVNQSTPFTFETVSSIFNTNISDLRARIDIDSDNDLDYRALRKVSGAVIKMDLIRNNGSGSYTTAQTQDIFCSGDYCDFTATFAVADFNRDGNEDMLSRTGTIELNGGSMIGIGATPQNATVYVNDFNNDGWPDILVLNPDPFGKSKLYKNNGSTGGPVSFTAVTDFPRGDRALWIDLDHNGYEDVIISGNFVFSVLSNNKDGTFNELKVPSLQESNNYPAVFDIDSDGDLDIYNNGGENEAAAILTNSLIDQSGGLDNGAPTAPLQLNASSVQSGVRLAWQKSTDDTTPADGITYDILLYTLDGKIISKASVNPATGSRQKLEPGRLSTTHFDLVSGVQPFHWRVQAVDKSNKGSVLSSSHFVVPPPLGRDTLVHRCARQVNISVTGTGIEWFSDEALTSKIGSGNVYHPEETQIVYATQTISGQRGLYRRISITIVDKPSAPVIENSALVICLPNNQATLTASGENIKWYSDEALTTVVGSGAQLTVTVLQETAYYATQSITNCTSDASSATITILGKPVIESNIALFCPATEKLVLTAEGKNLSWYSDSQLTKLAGTGTQLQVTRANDAKYYVTQSDGCRSEAEVITLKRDESCITGVESSQLDNSIWVAPNPAITSFRIKSTEKNHQFTSVSVFNSMGQRVHYNTDVHFDNDGLEIAAHGWRKGIYTVVLKNNDLTVVKRLILQ